MSATNITQSQAAHYRQSFVDNVTMVAQQMRSRLRGAVTEMICSGDSHRVASLLDGPAYQRRAGFKRNNEDHQAQFSARYLNFPDEIYSEQYIDRPGVLQMVTDPTSDIIRVHTAKVMQGWDDVILGLRPDGGSFTVAYGGILGVAQSGTTAQRTNTALPAGNFVAATVGGGGSATGLNLDKILQIVEDLRAAEFGMDDAIDPIYAAISPKRVTDLLKIAASTGVENIFDRGQLQAGKPTPLVGVNWIMTNRFAVDESGHEMVPFWTKGNIKLGIWQDTTANLDIDIHSNRTPHAQVKFRADCVRVQDAGVRVALCTR